MGNYIVKADLIEKLPLEKITDLTDDEGDGTQVDARVSAVIDDAEAEVDAYASARYSVPFLPVPKVIKTYTEDIAIYRLYNRREGPPDPIAEAHRNAMRFLENVSKGVVSIGVATPAPVNGSNGVDIKSDDRVFTSKTMRGF